MLSLARNLLWLIGPLRHSYPFRCEIVRLSQARQPAYAGPTEPAPRICDGAKGKRAMCLALLIAVARTRWCLAQVPVRRREAILPLSVMKFRSFTASL